MADVAVIEKSASFLEGKRPPGRPATINSPVAKRLRAILEKSLTVKMQSVVDAQIALAEGTATGEKVTKDGDVVEYREAPDTNAARLLFEFSMGKPKETIQHTGAIGIVAVIKQLSQGDEEQDNYGNDD